MPNQDNSVILEESHDALPITYNAITGIDDERSHAKQLIIYYRYGTVDGLGQDFSNETFTNWYDPYLIPEDLVFFDEPINTAVVGDRIIESGGGVGRLVEAVVNGYSQSESYRRECV